MSAQLNEFFLKTVWSELQKDLLEACIKYQIPREIGETIRAMSYNVVGKLALNHDKTPLFQLKHTDSAAFWNKAVDTASNSDDAEWSRITQHHALLMTSYPMSSDTDSSPRATAGHQRAMA